MRILLTGGSGFVGKALIPLLEHHEVLVISRGNYPPSSPNVSYLQGDLSDPEYWLDRVGKFSPEACIHLAWAGLPDYSFSQCRKNFNMSLYLFEFLSNINCKKILATGSGWEYGELKGRIKETESPNSASLFASFKTAIRLIGETLAKTNNIDFIWSRLFFVYGPGQRSTSLIPTCYQALKNKLKPDIRNPDGENDFIYVLDVARAILALIETPNISGTFNIGSGSSTKVYDVCNFMAQSMGTSAPFPISTSSPNEAGPRADLSFITKKTGWCPKVSIEEGISLTIGYLQKNNDSS